MPGYYSGPGNVLCACPASTQRRINHRHLPFLLYRTKRKSRADLCYSVAQWRRGRRRRNAHLRSARPRSPFLSDRVRFTVESGGGGKTVRDASPSSLPSSFAVPSQTAQAQRQMDRYAPKLVARCQMQSPLAAVKKVAI